MLTPIMRPILQPVMVPVDYDYGDAFNPLSLFAGGEQGFWYDPSDFSTLFQDAAGTTPVTALGQPVGLVLDKSGRGNHATQSTALSRPTLQQDSTGRYYLSFDGTDDFLSVPGSAATMKFLHDGTGASIWIGFSVSGGAVYHAIVNTSNLSTRANVGFNLSKDDRTVGTLINVICNGSGKLPVNRYAVDAPSVAKRVASVFNKTGEHITRKNGYVIDSSSTEVGSPSPANSTYNLTIGRSPTGLHPLNGRIYQLIGRGAETPLAQIVAMEQYINVKTGAY